MKNDPAFLNPCFIRGYPWLFIKLAITVFAFGCAQPVRAADADFRPIFDGRTLAGWDGDPSYWSARDGAIRGETFLDKMPLSNTFCIWRGGTLRNFELRLKFRIRNGNSGIQYRSQDLGKWVVAGYQAEIDNGPGKTGFLYHERGRKFLANLGERVEIDASGKPRVAGALAEKKELVKSGYYRAGEWNDYVIRAKGNRLEHFVNGVETIDATDNDPKGRALDGILAFQIHVGPPMLIEFKDILLKNQ